ncbi:MAG: polyprenol monophosphomannose synthase [Candidatus Moraniibacteriota bacterium]|nr:MAG: polyprenol monophosphomannose synthase [Candidatus Moranbacteria bacterium]
MPKLDLTILLPTYNEAANIAPLLRAVARSLEESDVRYEIVFVDDSSDMTPDVITRMREVYKDVRLIRRAPEERTGLATALIAGFAAAKGEYILCMDSDLQHPPYAIPELIAKLRETGADVTVATRYAAGGSAEGLGTLYRRAVSHLCRFAAWAIIPQTHKTTDPGSGFFVFRKSIVENLNFQGLQGFKILIDILARTKKLRVSEVPYTFRKRINNESKATVEQGIAFLRHLVLLKWQSLVPEATGPKSIESAIPARREPRNWGRISQTLLIDGAIALAIGLVGWYLVGYYAAFNYLYTGYEDWIYHAFRVKSLQDHGLVAWDHIWSNGIGYWKLYQYVAHYIMLGVVELTGLPITKVLLLSLVVLYIGLRVALYGILRLLGANRFFAVLPVIASYTIVQEWGSMQDYSIYIAFIAFPLHLLLWIMAFRDLKWIYVLAAVTGAVWTFHPVFGFNASILLGLLVVFSKLKSDFSKIFRVGIVYFIAAAPFLTSYFTAGYFFTNPLFKSYIYLSTSVLAPYGGLSMLYWLLFGIIWLLVIWRSQLVPTWTKVLLVYASVYLVLIYLGQKDYLPNFLVQFQFSRGITAVAFALVLVFGVVLQRTLGAVQGLGIKLVATVLIAAGIVHAVDIASRYYVSPPVNEIQNAVAEYFTDHDLPKGSVFTENVSEATYFAPAGVRYVTSYNEHMQPHPYSTRLRVLMNSRLGYTGISQAHLRNIENYATVLGIEYLFLPAASPLVTGLTSKDGAMFELVALENSEPLTDAIAVLRNTSPIISAFAVSRSEISDRLLSDELPLPTIHIASYKPWDERIAEMAEIVRSSAIVPIEVGFVPTNVLEIGGESFPKLDTMNDPIILVNQSYDAKWQVVSPQAGAWSVQPSTLRLMVLEKSGSVPVQAFELRNDWPWWYWPVQSLGVVMTLVAVLWTMKTHGLIRISFRKLSRYVNK